MFGEVGGVVPSGIEMEFVGDVARGEGFVERFGPGVKAVVVVVAAVEIDFQPGEIRRARQDDRAVLVPENGIRRTAEDAAEHPRARRAWRRVAEKTGQFFDQRGAVRADRAEKLRMAKSQMQRAETS